MFTKELSIHSSSNWGRHYSSHIETKINATKYMNNKHLKKRLCKEKIYKKLIFKTYITDLENKHGYQRGQVAGRDGLGGFGVSYAHCGYEMTGQQ